MRHIGILFLSLSLFLACVGEKDGKEAETSYFFDRPARIWEETFPLGNGRIGMMPDGGVERETIVLNEITLWSGSRQDADNPYAYYQLANIRRLLFEGRNDEAQRLMYDTFVCKGVGSNQGDGADAPYGSYQLLGNLELRYTYPDASDTITTYRRALRLDAGVVISASHNPYHDNGIKFFSADGTKLPDAVEEEIEAEITKGYQCVASDALGKAYRLDDACGRYVEFCKSTFPTGLDLKGMKLYLDCAHGAAYHAAPSVFHELGADIVSDGVEPDGFNINRGVGATHTDDLAERTSKAGADLGLSFDGDADRLIMADSKGNVYNGDALLYVMARERIEAMGKKSGVVGTLMTNFALEKRFAELGIPFERAKVGDRYVMERLLEKGWLYGGESSGHLIALDCQTTGDGIVSALQVLAAVVSSGKTLAELTADLQLMPQVLINRRIAKGYDWKANEKFAAEIKACEEELADRGRVLIRPSGTEPLLRIMVEARDKVLAQTLAERMAQALD